MFCAYCGKEKPETEMTNEHVLPRKIGGNLYPMNPFLLRNVCRTCNTAAGRHIDGPFIKSWFIHNHRAKSARYYLDLNMDPILPLIYIGELTETLLPDKVCDLWLGPTGDTIYHFHNPYPTYKGTDLVIDPPLYLCADDVDPGFAFLFVRASNPAWHKCIIFSFVEHFEESVLYLGNGPTPQGGRFSDIPQKLSDLHKRLKSMSGQCHKTKITLGINFGHRFLAKLALGCGALFLDSKFLQSQDATLLRDYMWSKNIESRSNIPIAGIPFLDQNFKPVVQLLGWLPGHIIFLMPLNDRLFLCPIFYGEISGVIQISSDSSLWKGKIGRDGTLFVIAPGFRKYVGPISLVEYLAAKEHEPDNVSPLTNLFSRVDSMTPLPPYDLIS
jgi:hypothetical protein